MRVLGKLVRAHWVLLGVWVLLSTVMAISYYNGGIIHFLASMDPDTVKDVIVPFQGYAELAFVFFNVVEVIIAPLHPSVLYVASGLLFGPIKGWILILLGNIIGSLIAFYIARRVGRPIVDRLPEEKVDKFDRFSEKYGPITLFLLRVNPLTNSDALNYLAGASNMSTRGFILATVLGHAPSAFLVSYFASAIVGSSPTLTILFIWASLLYIVFFVYIVVYNHYHAKLRKLKRASSQPK